MTATTNLDAERMARLRAWGDKAPDYRSELAEDDLEWLLDRAEEALLTRAAAKPEAPIDEEDRCTCSYNESDEMTRHAPRCKLAGAW